MASYWSGAIKPSLAMSAAMRPSAGPRVGSAREFYEVLDAYYRNNALYEELHAMAVSVGIIDPAILGLRNPANRVIEFYAKKTWPGQLPGALAINATKDVIIAAIHKLWEDSNWNAEKQVWARECALYGDAFLKVSTVNAIPRGDQVVGEAKRVYLQRIDPKLVTDFTTDERHFLTMIRLDEQLEPDPESPQTAGPIRYRTEIWNKSVMRVWVHEKGWDATPQQLGPVTASFDIAQWGIDFVPFVHAKFRDIGDDRGVSAFQHGLDKIDDLNRAVTRLMSQLYRHNDNTWVLQAFGQDAQRRPLPPLSVGSSKNGRDNLPIYKVAGSRLFSLPGGYELKSLIPQIDYNASLGVIKDAIEELRDDLPEMGFYRTRDFGTNLSGVALAMILSPAIASVEEMRGNIEQALVRAHKMALTIGKFLKLPLFIDVGNYEDGDLDHSFAERPVIALTQAEEVAIAAQKQALGVPEAQLLLELGYAQEQIDKWMVEKAAKDLAAQQQQVALQRQQFALQQDQAAAARQNGNQAGPNGNGNGRTPQQPQPPGVPVNIGSGSGNRNGR